MSERRKSASAIRACGLWLADCLKNGWDREKLDELEAIWWEHHDDNGNLTPSKDEPK